MNTIARHARLTVLALLGALVLSGPAFAQATADAAKSVTIFNFAKVSDDYYRGGQPLADHFDELQALGIKTIVNLTNEEDGRPEEQALAEQYGMRYVSIPMKTRKPPTDQEIAAFFEAVDEEGAVYVHCVGGRHRTGVMTAVYRMTREGLTGEQAFKDMKQYKYGPDFLHPEFKKFVLKYQPKAAAVAATAQQ
jgi:protein tyrosine/serine phosphatase